MGLSLFEKLWQRNLVLPESEERPALLYVGLHLLHEITAPQAFALLAQRGLSVRRPDLTLGMVDHCAPTRKDEQGAFLFPDPAAAQQINEFTRACQALDITLLGLGHRYQGIVHVVAPELGLSRPGQVIVCGDSHTSTHGAFGAIAFGIGSSEVAQVLATQCILQRQPRNMRVIVEGKLPEAVTAKDLALTIIQQIGAQGAQSYAIEYQGEAITAMTMEERMTLCNMSIECGARFGLIAPDAQTWAYLQASPSHAWAPVVSERGLFSDPDSKWEKEWVIEAKKLSPMMSWGTNPAMAKARSAPLPKPENPSEQQAFHYMGWNSVKSSEPRSVQHVFIGSCTNGRLSDLRQAAQLFRYGKVAAHLQCLIVPGSQLVKRQAEAEGLDQIFRQAGALWGEPSCSLCNAMNGDRIPAGELVVSTSNRNFEGRQGPGAQTILVSPVEAASIALRGYL